MTPVAGRALTFAYGSNMLHARIRARVPSAHPVGTAVLVGRELKWHKRGRDGSGKCDIVVSQAPEALVHGVLYAFSAEEKHLLDEAEGLGTGYEEVGLEVVANGQHVRVPAYQALQIQDTVQPFTWYKALVLAGARQHRLPPAYISRIESVAAIEDQDKQRHAMNMALANDV